MAAKSNIVVDQGTTFSTSLTLTYDNGDPIDISNYTITAKLKKWYTSSNSVSFAVAVSNAASGVVSISLSANTTANLVAGRYVYDVKTFNSDTATYERLVEGVLTVNPAVS